MPNQRDWDRVTIERMAKIWKKRRPTEVVAFMRAINQFRQGLLNDKAMSMDKSIMLNAMIPPKLDSFMRCVFGRNWKHDKEVAPEFWRVFSSLKIRPGATYKMRSDIPDRRDGSVQEARLTTQEELDIYRKCKELRFKKLASG